MKYFIIYFMIAGVFWTMVASAEGVRPFKGGDYLGAYVECSSYPVEPLKKQLSTGFSTMFLIKARLVRGEWKSEEVLSYMEMFYDLWDEVYVLKQSSARKTDQKQFKTQEKLLEYLGSFATHDIIPLNKLKKDKKFSIEINISMNPISKDRVEKMKKWLAESTVNPSLHKTGASEGESTKDFGMQFNRLFKKIFDEYTQSGTTKAEWSVQLLSQPVEVNSLKNAQ